VECLAGGCLIRRFTPDAFAGDAHGTESKPVNRHIAADLDCELEQINIKATTTEQLGFIGRKEGLAAYAVVLLAKAVSGKDETEQKASEQNR